MTNEQYDRWKDFAIRMATACYAAARRPSGAWILGVVEEWFDLFDLFDLDDIPTILDWDNSTVYPEGHPCRRRESQLSYCDCAGYRFTNNTPNPECPECNGHGTHYALIEGPLIGDMMSEFLEGYYPGVGECSVCLGDDDEGECFCDTKDIMAYDQWCDQWGGPVCCCVRAGLDLACSPSMGVVGFTAGDIRRMYPEGVPEWVAPPGERLTHWRTGEPNGLFMDLPDEAAMVL